MDAKELRLGNFVLDQNRKIKEISQSLDFDYADDYRPITLTEGWLAHNFGSDIVGFIRRFWAVDFSIDYNLTHGTIAFNIDNGVSFGIESVHQLQNLYFALTSEELKIRN